MGVDAQRCRAQSDRPAAGHGTHLQAGPAGYFGGFSSPVVPAANLQHKPRRLSVGGHSI